MTAHGTDPDSVDEATFTDICVMYIDGQIGNRGMLELLGSLTAGVYNYMRSEHQRAFTLQDTIPKSYEYLYPPLTPEQKAKQVNDGLMSYMRVSPNAPKDLFKEK